MRLCCEIGRARSALSKTRLVTVTSGCFKRNVKYISHILGILFSRTSARSKSAFTLVNSDASLAELLPLRCLTRSARYIFHNLYDRGSAAHARSSTNACSTRLPYWRLYAMYSIQGFKCPGFFAMSFSYIMSFSAMRKRLDSAGLFAGIKGDGMTALGILSQVSLRRIE